MEKAKEKPGMMLGTGIYVGRDLEKAAKFANLKAETEGGEEFAIVLELELWLHPNDILKLECKDDKHGMWRTNYQGVHYVPSNRLKIQK